MAETGVRQAALRFAHQRHHLSAWTGSRPSGSADPVNCAGRGHGAIGLPRPKMKIADLVPSS